MLISMVLHIYTKMLGNQLHMQCPLKLNPPQFCSRLLCSLLKVNPPYNLTINEKIEK